MWMLLVVFSHLGIDMLNPGEEHPVETLVLLTVTGTDFSSPFIPVLIPVGRLDKDIGRLPDNLSIPGILQLDRIRFVLVRILGHPESVLPQGK